MNGVRIKNVQSAALQTCHRKKMGKKIKITACGKTLSLSEWARELGISRQRASLLHKQNRLFEYINGDRKGSGRPLKRTLEERMSEVEDLNIWEAAKKVGIPAGEVFKYRNNVESSRKNR